MSFYFNDNSLQNQFSSIIQFKSSIEIILNIYRLVNKYNYSFYCSSSLLERIVIPNNSFRSILDSLDKNDKLYILNWLSKSGPFWESEREHIPAEYFDFENEIVTDSILAECAFKVYNNLSCNIISIQPSASFNKSPLVIKWYSDQENFKSIKLDNYWTSNSVEALLKDLEPELDSWQSLSDRVERDFPALKFLPTFSSSLLSEPFVLSIAKRAYTLISIIDQLKKSYNIDGSPSKLTHEIIKDHFTGDNSTFSDSSESEKKNKIFCSRMTFDGHLCPWHGKIRYKFFRLHFSWPILANEPTYISYLGPKLTK